MVSLVGKWICFKRGLRCDKSNAEEIVLEMLAYLETADYSIREEMVLKVAMSRLSSNRLAQLDHIQIV